MLLELILAYLAYSGVVSLIAFILMGFDKHRARTGGWRVKETTFYTLSLLQGYPGILLGAKVFHHKTRKILFQLINLVSYITGIVILIEIITKVLT